MPLSEESDPFGKQQKQPCTGATTAAEKAGTTDAQRAAAPAFFFLPAMPGRSHCTACSSQRPPRTTCSGQYPAARPAAYHASAARLPYASIQQTAAPYCTACSSQRPPRTTCSGQYPAARPAAYHASAARLPYASIQQTAAPYCTACTLPALKQPAPPAALPRLPDDAAPGLLWGGSLAR